MKHSERIAITRIIVDLIKADNVIDVGEMEMYAQLRGKYSITIDIECEAVGITLSDAITTMQDSDSEVRNRFLLDCEKMTVSDGYCAIPEALLMIALKECLNDKLAYQAEVISSYDPDLMIGERQAIYVESQWSKSNNEAIQANFRAIDSELRLAGFNFVYIPHVAAHYKEFNTTTFSDVVNFLAPYLSEVAREELKKKLSNMTTVQFVQEQLCDRLQMKSLRSAGPSLLFKIGSDYVGSKLYGNFLMVNVCNDIVNTVQRLMDYFVEKISTDKTLVSHTKEHEGQFLYHGFYKQLFDMYTLRRGIEGSLQINPYRGDLLVPEIDTRLKGLRRKEKALYVLLLLESIDGGVSFNPPTTYRQMEAYKQRMAQLKKRYNAIYELFGGEKDAAPDIERAEIRRPMIAIIRKSIASLEGELRNARDYSIEKTEDGLFRIPIDTSCVKVLTISGYVLLKEFCI